MASTVLVKAGRQAAALRLLLENLLPEKVRIEDLCELAVRELGLTHLEALCLWFRLDPGRKEVQDRREVIAELNRFSR
jgi:hypothetical protein